jgi:DNA-binding GntR family transcriptional regulator
VAAVSPGRAAKHDARPKVRSVSGQVTDTIRHMILMGDLRPEEQVTQDYLAKELGVSTMPVREALLQLSHEGFIISGRGRAFRVARTTRQDIADVYWMHSTLAGELTSRACANVDANTLRELDAIHASWVASVRDRDAGAMTETNFEFHRLINHVANSPKLLLLMRNTLRMIPERFYSMLPEWPSSSTDYHRGILDALHAGDRDKAAAEASEHVQEAGRMLIQFFDEKGYWTAPESGG